MVESLPFQCESQTPRRGQGRAGQGSEKGMVSVSGALWGMFALLLSGWSPSAVRVLGPGFNGAASLLTAGEALTPDKQ